MIRQGSERTIYKIKDYFNLEIKERKEITKKLTFSLISHAAVAGIPVGLAGSSLTVLFSITTGIVKKILNTTRKKKKKHNKIIVLARNFKWR